MSLVPCPFVPLSHVLGAQGVLSITEGDAGSPLRPPTLSFLLPALRGVHQGHAERGAGLRGAAGERSWEPGVRGRTVPESLMWAVGHIWGRGGGHQSGENPVTASQAASRRVKITLSILGHELGWPLCPWLRAGAGFPSPASPAALLSPGDVPLGLQGPSERGRAVSSGHHPLHRVSQSSPAQGYCHRLCETGRHWDFGNPQGFQGQFPEPC